MQVILLAICWQTEIFGVVIIENRRKAREKGITTEHAQNRTVAKITEEENRVSK